MADVLEERSDEVATAISELAGLLVAEESVESTLQRIADLARRTVPDCDAAGVTLRSGSSYLTVAWTDQRTLRVDEAQYARDHGPCLHAMRTGTIVRLGLGAADAEWPDFAAAARAYEVCSFLAAPLTLGGKGIGALNLYSRQASGFDALDDGLVAMFTGQATVALANARVHEEALTISEQLRTAMTSRAVIEQAKGALMARYGMSAEAAFSQLREQSQHRNVKLRDIAAEVVASTQITTPSDAALAPPRPVG